MPWAALVLLLLGAGAAQAQVVTLGTSGTWVAFGGQQRDGRQVCGIALRGDSRSVQFSYFAGRPDIIVEVFRRGWDFPAEAPTALTLQPAGTATPLLRGEQRPRDGARAAHLSVVLPYDESGPFWQALRGAAILRVFFTTGPERAWTMATTGSAGAVSTMTTCLQRIGASTLPIENPASARPAESLPSGAEGG